MEYDNYYVIDTNIILQDAADLLNYQIVVQILLLSQKPFLMR